jgi:hypothetical protein
MIRLGEKVRCRITGFEGTVVARYEFLAGCVRLEVTSPNLDKDGKPLTVVFDEPQLEVVVATPAPKAEVTGGDRDASPRRSDPSRR